VVQHCWTIVKAEACCPGVDDTPTQRVGVCGSRRRWRLSRASGQTCARRAAAPGLSGEADRKDARGVETSLADQEGDAPGRARSFFPHPGPAMMPSGPVVCGNGFHLGRGEAAISHWMRAAARLAFQACQRSKCSSMTSRKGFGHLNLRRTSSSNSGAGRAAGARSA